MTRVTPVTPVYRTSSQKYGKSERESPWFQYGTDEDYKAWCRKQRSAYSAKTGDIVYAHYRTAANSGTGMKPPFSGLPLTMQEHQMQHRIGQYNFRHKTWWEDNVREHLERWASEVSCKSRPCDVE